MYSGPSGPSTLFTMVTSPAHAGATSMTPITKQIILFVLMFDSFAWQNV